MKTIKSKVGNKFKDVIGIASTCNNPFYNRSNKIFVSDKIGLNSLGYLACITNSTQKPSIFQPPTAFVESISAFSNNDIIQIMNDGRIRFLWEINSNQNSFLLTESCNCKCLMCPQPIKPHSEQLVINANKILDLLSNQKLETICITGGEPTLLKDAFLSFLNRCINEHPESNIDILTNGKTFSDKAFTREVASIATKNVLFCVSLHSDVPHIHDKIVGCNGSYNLTQKGIYNLATYDLLTEIRHVITKINFSRLVQFANHLYNYFPFCSHYAFMAMEVFGFAQINKSNIVATPDEYIRELCQAVLEMDRRELPISVYNVPLCMCDKRIWQFTEQSISKWKNIYLPECKGCKKQEKCAGFFATSSYLPANNLKPFLDD